MEENNSLQKPLIQAKNKFFLFERKHQLITLFGLVILLAGYILIFNQIRYVQDYRSSAQTPITYTSTSTSTPTPTSSASATLTPTPKPSTTSATLVKVIYPNGKETLYKGKTYTIKWTFTTKQPKTIYPLATTVVLQSANLNVRRTVYTILNKPYTKAGTNTLNWKVPSTIPTASNYRISIQVKKLFPTSKGGSTYPKDESDKDFKITNSRIAGYVFLDNNANGKWDTKLGEKAYTKGAVIGLSGGAVLKRKSSKTGVYEFPNLYPKKYAVSITAPIGYKVTTLKTVYKTLPPDARFDFGIAPIPTVQPTRFVPSLQPSSAPL